MLWDGTEGPLEPELLGVNPKMGWHKAIRVGPERITMVGQHPQMPGADNYTATSVLAERRGPDPTLRELIFGSGYKSYIGFFPHLVFPLSSAAISANWWTVVALQEGEFHVLGPEGEERMVGDLQGTLPVPDWTVKFPYYLDQVSIVPPGIAILEGWTGGSGALKSTDGSLPTTVHYLTGKGEELWQATLAFRAGQPAIDCGGGRICVAGDGLASIKEVDPRDALTASSVSA